jgi:hypothetical protein
MSTSLDPAIRKQLDAFAQRWQRVVLWRGLGALLAVLVGSLVVLAWLDRLVVMPDPLRIGLTVTAYLATFATFWWWSGRFLMRRPGPRELARLVEKAEPGLREDLLSAIELGDTEATWDSPAFRELLTRDVAARITNVKPESVFPNALVKRWLIAAGVAVGVCAVLLVIPPLQFNRLLLRAAAPMLDIERVSRFQIALVNPTQARTVVPRGDSVPVTVNITGGRPYDVSLEVFSGNGRADRIAMTATATDGQFSAALPANGAEIEFRVCADDAMTRRFQIAARERPQALRFEKEYVFPEYAALPKTNVTEESGDLSALEGTRVKLVVHADQPIAQGELQLTLANQPHVIPLKALTTNQLTAEVPVVASGSYRVKLVAAETGFENKFSPEFEIRPQADLVPRVELVSPKGNQMIAPDELLNLLGSARDDFGVAKVARVTRVNQEPWVEFTLASNAGPATVVSQRWDVLELNLQTGDQLALKLVATDTKGNRTETMPLQLTIVSSSFDAQRLKALDARRKALNAAEALAKAARELERAASELTRKADQAGDLQAQQSQLNLSNRIAEVFRSADAAWLELKLAVHQTRPGREGADLALAGAPMARARAQLQSAARAPAPTDAEASRLARQEFTTTLRRAAESAESTVQVQAHLLAAEELDVAHERLTTLRSETTRLQTRLTRKVPGTNDPVAEVVRRVPGIAAETASVEPLLDQAALHAGRNFTERVKAVRDGFAKQKEFLAGANLEGKRATDIAGQLTLATRNFSTLADNLARLKVDVASQADQARASAKRALPATSVQLEELWKYQESLAALEAKAANDESRGARLRVEVLAKWVEAAVQARALADIEEVRVDSDAAFVADLGATAEVVQQLDTLHNGTGGERRAAVEPVKRLATALRQLEMGHRFNDLVAGVRALAEQERWEPVAAIAGTARPRDWQWINAQLKTAPEELRKLKLPLPSADEIEQLARSTLVGGITVEMDARFRKNEEVHPQSEPLEELLARLTQLNAELLASLAEARVSVREAAPKLSERMDTLARAAAALEKQTRTQAEATEKAAEVNRTETTQLAEQQADLAKEIESLRDALRRDANAQNLATPEGRERARDDDDANAMLREPPQRATDLLRTAAATRETTNAVATLQAAAQQQQLTAETLRKLAQHFANAEAGKPELTRAELRAAEEALGIKSQLDEQYRQAEMLADLSKMSAEQQMQQLEEMLKQNPLMQQELSNISKSALKSAAGQLQQAAEDEKNVGNQLRTAAMTENNDATRLVNQLKQLAAEAERLAKQDVPAASKAARAAALNSDTAMDTAAEAVSRAIEKFNEATSPADVSTLSAASAALKVAEENLRETAGAAATAPTKTDAVKNAQTQAARAAQNAAALAQRASDLLQSAGNAATSKAQALAKSAQQQQRVNQLASDASEMVARAARHEERLNNPENTERVKSLNAATTALAQEMLPPVAQAIQKTPNAANIQPQIEAAQKAIESTAAMLNQAIGEGANGNQQPKQNADAQAKNEAQQAARALDKLDQMMKGQKPSNQASQQQAAKQTAQQMAQAQQQAQKSQRTEGQLKEQTGTGAENYYTTAAGATGVLPALPNAGAGGTWGKLPPKMAQELSEGTREGVSGEYRSMVDTYFRVIADRARATPAP